MDKIMRKFRFQKSKNGSCTLFAGKMQVNYLSGSTYLVGQSAKAKFSPQTVNELHKSFASEEDLQRNHSRVSIQCVCLQFYVHSYLLLPSPSSILYHSLNKKGVDQDNVGLYTLGFCFGNSKYQAK